MRVRQSHPPAAIIPIVRSSPLVWGGAVLSSIIRQWTALLILAAPGAVTGLEAAEPPSRPPATQTYRTFLQTRKNRLATLPVVDRPVAPAELPQLILEQNLLRFRPRGELALSTYSRLNVTGSDADWVLWLPHATGDQVILEQYRFDHFESDDFWMIAARQSDGLFNLMAYGGTGSGVYHITFTQRPRDVNLNVVAMQDEKAGHLLATARAGDFEQLQARHPIIVRKFLRPVLRLLAGRDVLLPGPGEVYAAFPELGASPEVQRQLEQVLIDLDSPFPDERSAATQRLTELGAPAVLAALRLDRRTLSPEQRTRIDSFIASQTHRTAADPAALLRDEGFLLDCLEFDDPAVRIAAKGRLEQLLGRPIGFDPGAPEQERARAAAELRTDLARPEPDPDE